MFDEIVNFSCNSCCADVIFASSRAAIALFRTASAVVIPEMTAEKSMLAPMVV
ncbi:hypothetical protein [Verminephrobacter aporrectodeae]|uniref:hypothetical protein n=1 Tax=Verminephrobacter aporrectodeae TaxID=1110389 RepID=UPI0022379D6B|nr:hypothetical protein [Verminephrobacter aporrectodeae]